MSPILKNIIYYCHELLSSITGHELLEEDKMNARKQSSPGEKRVQSMTDKCSERLLNSIKCNGEILNIIQSTVRKSFSRR